jgi:hypothetical protein
MVECVMLRELWRRAYVLPVAISFELRVDCRDNHDGLSQKRLPKMCLGACVFLLAFIFTMAAFFVYVAELSDSYCSTLGRNDPYRY